MINLCFYFQVHQPKRLRKYTVFDIGKSHFYEDDEVNRSIMQKVANKCYLPANNVMLQLIKQYEGRFKISYSITGMAIEQFKRFSPETLDSFKRLADTGCVEFINETYNHSLCFLFSKDEFVNQLRLHKEMVQKEFGQTPCTFRNTELIYNNDVASAAEDLGYSVILAEGADKILGWRSPNFVYQPQSCQKIRLLLRNYKLSDDIAFRFSNREWNEFPLTTEKYASWIHSHAGSGEVINFFMDYETFGEHQWADTGIFEFLNALPASLLNHPDFCFTTPSEIRDKLSPVAKLDVPEFISWADIERDLTAWKGNSMQDDALETLYSLRETVYKKGDPNLLAAWRFLQTSDYFYYMCTKWFADGDVHKYFNPYKTPYEAYINFQNVLADFILTLEQ
ncbi:MAG: polysaccharide deacetylase family protein [Planctomycetes bacterium]|nr:polysaccharide deacetylase family protein [Planctomycetota bacterium]